MIRIRQGQVIRVLKENVFITEVLVDTEGQEVRSLNYNLLTGPVKPGEMVALNTTAVHKSLGTGGQHFVMANLSLKQFDSEEPGHIMKLRYTPSQVKCLAVEEEDSPYHKEIKETLSIEGMPVIVSTLHSMLPLILGGIRSIHRGLKVAYIMTDGAALPLWFSNMVATLKEKGWLYKTITIGHAFGGDFEAVNIYSGLVAARAAVQADVAVVGMGPGIVGTGTPLGFTGAEQGEIINAVNIMEGQALAVPRISFADSRPRHRGVSHHSLTALGRIALTRAKVVIHNLEPEKREIVDRQLADSGVLQKHDVVFEDGWQAVEEVREAGLKVTTMGRTMEEDLDFFLTCGAAGIVGARML